MNNIDNAALQIGKIKALTECVEDAMISAASETGLTAEVEKMHNLFYVLMDAQEALFEALEAAQGDSRVCNVILTINHVRELEEELARLKKKG